MTGTDDSTEKSKREWPEGTGFAVGLVGFIGWVLLYGEYGITLTVWQLDFFGAPKTDALLMAAWIVMAFAPVIAAAVILFVRGDFHNAD